MYCRVPRMRRLSGAGCGSSAVLGCGRRTQWVGLTTSGGWLLNQRRLGSRGVGAELQDALPAVWLDKRHQILAGDIGGVDAG